MRMPYRNTTTALAAILGTDAPDTDVVFTSISTDSRDCDSETLYVPICGEKFDGHDFIEELCAQGRVAAYLTH